MSLAALIADMVAAGVPADLIGRTAELFAAREPVKAVDEQAERRRAADRVRKAEVREEEKRLRNSAEVCGHVGNSADIADELPLQKKAPQTPKENYPLSSEPSVPRCESARRHVWPEDFAKQVWELFPRKTEKQAGMTALADLHRRDRLPWSELIAGIRSLAEAVENPKFAPALHRWLKRERWEDQHPAAARPPPMPTRNNRSLIDGLDEIERRFSDVPAPSYPRLAG